MAKQTNNGAPLGFEAELFKTADKLRGNMEPSDYKHVALGLIFLKHILDSFETRHAELLADYPEGAEDKDDLVVFRPRSITTTLALDISQPEWAEKKLT